MKQELQDNIGFRDLTCLMMGKLSHKITIPDIVLDQFRAVITNKQHHATVQSPSMFYSDFQDEENYDS